MCFWRVDGTSSVNTWTCPGTAGNSLRPALFSSTCADKLAVLWWCLLVFVFKLHVDFCSLLSYFRWGSSKSIFVQQVTTITIFPSRPSHTQFYGISSSCWEILHSLAPFFLFSLNRAGKSDHFSREFLAWAKINRRISCNSLDVFYLLSCSSRWFVSSSASSKSSRTSSDQFWWWWSQVKLFLLLLSDDSFIFFFDSQSATRQNSQPWSLSLSCLSSIFITMHGGQFHRTNHSVTSWSTISSRHFLSSEACWWSSISVQVRILTCFTVEFNLTF